MFTAKRVLILSQSYPSGKNIYENSFVHSRSIEYLRLGVDVDVINFLADKNYVYEGVNVYKKGAFFDISLYDAVISHAPNIKNHYFFIKKHLQGIKKLIFVFHGHEALYVHDYYPKPYSWNKKNSVLKIKLRYLYDYLKLRLLRDLLLNKKVKSIFVSQWMKKESLKCLNISENKINYKVINNPINYAFYHKSYELASEPLADFISIRPLSGSKYAVDLIIDFARNNPDKSFHIYGKGNMFDFIEKPINVSVFSEFIEQKNIPKLLNNYRVAIMPTRLDAQGVMMCEMASYGIPIIVSDLPVCHEMLSGFVNCQFVNNDKLSTTKADELSFKKLEDRSIIEKFSPIKLAKKELEYILS